MKNVEKDAVSILEEFRPLFYPESVALVGASQSPAKIGYPALRNIPQFCRVGDNPLYLRG